MAQVCCFILIVAVAASASYRFRNNPKPEHKDSNDKTCGKSTVELRLRSSTGPADQDAEAHSWPWVVSIQFRNFLTGTSWRHSCTGTLVSARVVVVPTACYHWRARDERYSPINWLAVLGSHNSSVWTNLNTSITIESINELKDFVLFTLAHDFPINPFINNICMRKERFPVGFLDCYLVGWNSYFRQDYGQNLTQAKVQLVSKEKFEKQCDGKFDDSLGEDEIAAMLMDSWVPREVPLMCRSWCDDTIGQWFLAGYDEDSRVTCENNIQFLRLTAPPVFD